MGLTRTISLDVPAMRMKHLRQFVEMAEEADDDAFVLIKSERFNHPTDRGSDRISVTIGGRVYPEVEA